MDISWYETTLFTDDGAPSYIPNAVFISSTILNEVCSLSLSLSLSPRV
jgi:small-conductance mechanosensitive channel